MEPVGEEEAQLVLLSQKSFVSLFYTESDLENDSASFEEKTEGDLHGRSTNLGFGKKAEMEEKSLAEKNHSIP